MSHDLIYVTDSIILKNNHLYYENTDGILKKINKTNCLNHLSELGWEEMDNEWECVLFNKMNTKSHINPYFILDCGGSGNCLYYCIAEALNNVLQFPDCIINNNTDMESVKKLALDNITKDNFDIILMTYKSLYEEGEMYDDWNPNEIKTINELQDKLQNSWGDHITIQLLQQAIQKNIIIFNNYLFSDNENYISSITNELKYPESIFLYYIDNIHFQLIGKFNGNTIQTVFKRIPKEIKNKMHI
tara:strand:- start:197 stop:931 length:735 start_codon:yes stop_codon:yes gene_type:complete